MAKFTYQVEVHWDPEASVWVATSEDVPGLATEADSMESMMNKLRIIIPELMQANGSVSDSQPHEISFEMIGRRLESVLVGA